MKKIILIAASLLITSITFAHGNGWSKNNNNSEKHNQYWQQMNTRHQLMHNTKVEVKNTESGVNLGIILPSDIAQGNITSDFQLSQENLAVYFKSVEVSLETQEKGWIISFSSSEDSLIKKLQHSGSGL
jgi:uncharacterized protein YdeI (BOF family)